jgi:hypothetical protein
MRLLLLELEGTLTLYDLRLLHLRRLLTDVLTLVRLVRLSLRTLLLESPLAFVFLPLLELLLALLLRTVLTVTAGFVLRSTPCSPTLHS